MVRRLAIILYAASLTPWLTTCQSPSASETAPENIEVLSEAALSASHHTIDFSRHVKPVLEAKCVICHNRKTLPFFSLENREMAFAEPARIVPGHPGKSLLIINGTINHAKTMPPVGNRLTRDEKRILAAWVKQGAVWPSGKAGDLLPAPDAPVR